MKLPNREESCIPLAKITEYLLNENHPIGSHKAAFFESFCFSNSQLLVEALLNHAIEREVNKETETPFGTKYELICELKTPDNRNPCIVSVWIINNGETIPKLITAYPN
jgi:hypothetical protein